VSVSFDPAVFEAEVTLGLLTTDRLPSVAQDVLEAGWDGPGILRMAILDAHSSQEIVQTIPHVMAELGLRLLSPKEAGMRLAKRRAQAILDSGENPFRHLPYFYRLACLAEWPDELVRLGLMEDRFIDPDNQDERQLAVDALQQLLDSHSNDAL